jgi:hypothetical protein
MESMTSDWNFGKKVPDEVPENLIGGGKME